MKILILNQAFFPDVVATAQIASDLGAYLAAKGHSVSVICSSRAYDHPEERFQRRENWRGVGIRRVWASGLGKRSLWARAVDFTSFLGSCFLQLLFEQRHDVVIALTTPPLIAFWASLFVHLKGGRLLYWVMDMNPDQAIAAGLLQEDSLLARVLKSVHTHTLKSASRIVVLDRFMRDRLLNKGVPADKIDTVPPWPHDDLVQYTTSGREEFRREHGMDGKFVVMYAGNHSPCHPLDALLEAAKQLAEYPDIVFCFVGGGVEHKRIRELVRQGHLPNVSCLPYQPLEKLSNSLSAADLHVVVLGDAFLGIVHPCKVYNVLALRIPILYIGPPESHVTDLARVETSSPWLFPAPHGAVNTIMEHILAVRQSPCRRFEESAALSARFSQDALMARIAHSIMALAD